MLGFTGLRLSGFKSFVDATELTIAEGLTGVVGPNGCGKSNLIEALRWVMGESSARNMRGAEMDDIIFGGSSGRPARNVAEVSVLLDNKDRAAPSRFDGFEQIEVVRRIERGMGSSYRINGVETRARDVQLLFADAATGARSSGLVSQGRIGAIINARPADRRSLLEEAAGISGLHSRRHEAEGRLNAAGANLTRLDDVMGELAGQITALAKQAKQAERYRHLSEQIRVVEAQVLYMEWLEALAMIERARLNLRAASEKVRVKTAEASAAATAQAQLAAEMPALRAKDSESSDVLRGLVFEREKLEAEAARLTETAQDLERRRQQAANDWEREKGRSADGVQAIARLDAEASALTEADQGNDAQIAAAKAALEQAHVAVTGTEADLSREVEAVAAHDAARANALRRLTEAETRKERLGQRLNQLRAQHQAVAAEGLDRADLTSAEMDVEAAVEFADEARKAVAEGEAAMVQARKDFDITRDARAKAHADYTRLKAEADALRSVLASVKRGPHAPVLDKIAAEPGWEAALAAALGDDLSASLEANAPLRWEELPPLSHPPVLPDGVDVLARHVTAPLALARRLAQVGVVETLDAASAVMDRLAVGQRVVTKRGDLVRWDGYRAQAGAPSAMAAQLSQRNRLRDVETALEDAKAGENRTAAAAAAAQEKVTALGAAETRARETLRRADADRAKAQDSHAKLAQRFAGWDARLAALVDQIAVASQDMDEAQSHCAQATAAVAEFPAQDEGRLRVESLRATLAQQRTHLVEARSTVDRLVREAGERQRRRDAIAQDRAQWVKRMETVGQHLADLEMRQSQAAEELERLSGLPAQLEGLRADLLTRQAQAESARRAAADALIATESRLAEADRRWRAQEHELSEAREALIRDEATVSGADQHTREVATRIAERLDISPERLRDMAGVDPDAPPDRSDLQRRFDRLSRERDAMGPVNLRAELELRELEERLEGLKTERADLEAAIAKLRHAIADLNAEGRERLKASFQLVDAHFRDLFVKLFGGGQAHLALVESDDPLAAGLEIMASPPGKRLQVLSLLSGGEQALTALALLFAVFMTNPAPICVLDEVDAPLDDANVDRFCSLVEGLSLQTGTRFLIITHHRMSMARMHRLFGVTMAERGVSQLVSVDLNQAVLVRDGASR